MNAQRLYELEKQGACLTEQEIIEGWHFCPDWDYLLIGPMTPEMEACTCHIPSCKPGK